MQMERGILVDYKGNVLSLLQWDASKKRPRIEQKTKNPRKKKYLLSGDVYVEGCENFRWSFKEKRWIKPQKVYALVDERGGLRTTRCCFKDRLPPAGIGMEWVESEPPKKKGRKPIWTGTEWQFPRVVEFVNEEGEVINRVLENPRDDQPNVEPPEGCEKRYAT